MFQVEELLQRMETLKGKQTSLPPNKEELTVRFGQCHYDCNHYHHHRIIYLYHHQTAIIIVSCICLTTSPSLPRFRTVELSSVDSSPSTVTREPSINLYVKVSASSGGSNFGITNIIIITVAVRGLLGMLV